MRHDCSTKVRPNEIWQDRTPRKCNQTVRVVLTLPYLGYFKFSNTTTSDTLFTALNRVQLCSVIRGTC